MGRRTAMPRYPDLRRGEDTALCLAILAAGHRVARLRRAGWCYVYTCHGANAWSVAHHAAISAAKSLGPAQLVALESVLRQRVAEFDPPIGRATLRHAHGEIVIGA
jgi:hypothetical protein